MSSSRGKAPATDSDPPPPKPPKPPRMYVLVSKDPARITIPLKAALLSNKIRYDGRDTLIKIVPIDAATLGKIVPYLTNHAGCSEEGKKVMNDDELKEWDHSVFLNEPIQILLSMLHAALWLQIPDMVKLLESKLAPTDHN